MTTAQQLARSRPIEPPYLIATRTDRRAVSVSVTADASITVVEMKVHGQWSQQLGSQVAATLRLCLTGPATAVIIDLLDLGDLHGVSLPFWTAAVRTARLGPVSVRMALCLPSRTMLDYRLRHADAHQPLIFTTMPEARMGVARALPSSPRRFQARLAPQPHAVRAARDLVEQACHAWRLPEVRNDALLIMSELAANAVEHARTDAVATVVRAGTRLHLVVRDGDTRFPRLTAPVPLRPGVLLEQRGRGLHLVHALATAWGAMPARSGKVVWATVSPTAPL